MEVYGKINSLQVQLHDGQQIIEADQAKLTAFSIEIQHYKTRCDNKDKELTDQKVAFDYDKCL